MADDKDKDLDTDTGAEDAETAEEETEEETSEDEAEADQNTDIDYDAEAEKEKKRGKPDPIRAQIAKKERDAKRAGSTDAESDDDKPATVGQIKEILTQTTRDQQAMTIARTLTTNVAEANAIVAKWANRGFPADMPLQEQVEEMYGALNRKKLLTTTKELTRALKSKGQVSKDAGSAHRDATGSGSEPKLAAADLQGIKSAGYVWDAAKKLWKKPLNKKGTKHLWMNGNLKGQSWVA